MNSLLPAAWAVPQVFRKRLGEQAGRQRAMSADGHLLLVLHELPKGDDPERSPALFWRDPSGTWRALGTGSGLAEIEAYLGEVEKRVDQLEAKMQQPPTSEVFFEVLRSSTPLLRLVRNAHRALQEGRELVADDRALLNARDRMGEQERSLELLNSDAKNGLEFMIAKRSEEQSRNSEQIVASGYKLNLLVAMFLPLTALGSAFGMNFHHGFEDVASPWLFWSVLLIGIVVGFIVKGSVSAPGERRRS